MRPAGLGEHMERSKGGDRGGATLPPRCHAGPRRAASILQRDGELRRVEALHAALRQSSTPDPAAPCRHLRPPWPPGESPPRGAPALRPATTAPRPPRLGAARHPSPASAAPLPAPAASLPLQAGGEDAEGADEVGKESGAGRRRWRRRSWPRRGPRTGAAQLRRTSPRPYGNGRLVAAAASVSPVAGLHAGGGAEAKLRRRRVDLGAGGAPAAAPSSPGGFLSGCSGGGASLPDALLYGCLALLETINFAWALYTL